MLRRRPRWEEFRPLLGLRAPPLTRRQRVAQAATVRDLRRLAARRAPRAVFDYVDGAAETEASLRRARAAYAQVELRPHVLRDVDQVDTTREILGARAALPVVLAPTGFTRMMHAEGESAVAGAAACHGLPYALSTLGTTTPEDLAAAAPDTRRWFQLYVPRDRGLAGELVDRAAGSGYEALMLTVDTAVGGLRLRDVRNGLTIPPKLGVRTLLDMAVHPAWWVDLLTTEPLAFASLRSFDGTVGELVDRLFDPGLTFADVEWLRERWDGPLIVKGVQSVEDAREVATRGADAVVLSNHGGRQLDRGRAPLLLLPEVVDAVDGRVEVMVDGGILGGADVIAAVAAGARAVLVGRLYLYGLMAGGRDGVDRALDILREEVERTLRLLGVRAVDELGSSHVVLPAG